MGSRSVYSPSHFPLPERLVVNDCIGCRIKAPMRGNLHDFGLSTEPCEARRHERVASTADARINGVGR